MISPYVANDLYLEIEQRLSRFSGFGALLPVHDPLYYGSWLGLWLIASVGLFFFQNWARHLFLLLYVISTLLLPASGFAVLSPFQNFFGQIVSVLDGVILTMAYLPPLGANFKRKSEKPGQ